MTAMKLDGEYFACDTGKKYPADVCMMVLLRCLSYPCTFWQLATEFLCEWNDGFGWSLFLETSAPHALPLSGRGAEIYWCRDLFAGFSRSHVICSRRRTRCLLAARSTAFTRREARSRASDGQRTIYLRLLASSTRFRTSSYFSRPLRLAVS